MWLERKWSRGDAKKEFWQQAENTPAAHGASPSPLMPVSCEVRLPGCCDVHSVLISIQSLQPWIPTLLKYLQHLE